MGMQDAPLQLRAANGLDNHELGTESTKAGHQKTGALACVIGDNEREKQRLPAQHSCVHSRESLASSGKHSVQSHHYGDVVSTGPTNHNSAVNAGEERDFSTMLHQMHSR